MIRGKVAEYMERAEKLKQHLNQNDASNRKKPAAIGSNGKASGGSGKGGGYVLPSYERCEGLQADSS
jgi:vacuolar protein-sorting-associated protein 4